MDKSPILGGSVINPDGSPAKNVSVIIHPFGDHVYTDEEGKFAAGYDEERTGQGIFVMARDPERCLTALVRTKEFKKPIELTLGPALAVKGKITDPNGIGIPASRVSLCFHFTNCLSDMSAEVLTDFQGYFMFNAIPPVQSDSDYRVSVHAAGFGPKTYERISIEGQAGETVNVQTIQLTPANVSISGIVVDANGLPAARVPIFLQGADGSDQPDKSTATNEQGRFEIHRICKVPLRLQANFSSSPGGAGFLYAQGGDWDVKIILGKEGVHRPQTSLIGKPLPELKELGIELSPDETTGKKILVCILDLEQRPSRHFISELVNQAEHLQNKGIAVIAVQASKMEQEALSQWVNKYNIPFPVGMLQGDVEKAHFNWAVQSLPWLILTDTQHTVIAEGFGLNELEDKIKAASQ
jgi:hypothetical protein